MSWIDKIFGKKVKFERPGGPHSKLHCYALMGCQRQCSGCRDTQQEVEKEFNKLKMKTDNQKLSEYQECREFLRLSEPESLLQEIQIIKSHAKCNYNGVDQDGVDWKALAQQYAHERNMFELENKKLVEKINLERNNAKGTIITLKRRNDHLQSIYENILLEKASMGNEIVKLTEELADQKLKHLNELNMLKSDYESRIGKSSGPTTSEQVSYISAINKANILTKTNDELKKENLKLWRELGAMSKELAEAKSFGISETAWLKQINDLTDQLKAVKEEVSIMCKQDTFKMRKIIDLEKHLKLWRDFAALGVKESDKRLCDEHKDHVNLEGLGY